MPLLRKRKGGEAPEHSLLRQTAFIHSNPHSDLQTKLNLCRAIRTVNDMQLRNRLAEHQEISITLRVAGTSDNVGFW